MARSGNCDWPRVILSSGFFSVNIPTSLSKSGTAPAKSSGRILFSSASAPLLFRHVEAKSCSRRANLNHPPRVYSTRKLITESNENSTNGQPAGGWAAFPISFCWQTLQEVPVLSIMKLSLRRFSSDRGFTEKSPQPVPLRHFFGFGGWGLPNGSSSCWPCRISRRLQFENAWNRRSHCIRTVSTNRLPFCMTMCSKLARMRTPCI